MNYEKKDMKHLKLFENFSQDSGESQQPMEVTICMDSDCMVQSLAEIKFEGEIPHIVSGSYKGDLWNELPSVYDDELEEIFSKYKSVGLGVEKTRISNLSNPDISYRGANDDYSGEFTVNSSSINRKLETGELRLRKDESIADNQTPFYYLEVVS